MFPKGPQGRQLSDSRCVALGTESVVDDSLVAVSAPSRRGRVRMASLMAWLRLPTTSILRGYAYTRARAES
jgi:hypothetical protein